MAKPICKPLSRAEPGTVTRTGVCITDLRATSGTVFSTVSEPPARVARVRRVANAYGNWREGLPLNSDFSPFALGWPLDVDLRPGFLLDADSGVPRWEAERAVEGLLAGEARYIELASGLLVEAQGCVLELPGGVNAVLVRADEFTSCVTVREPLLLSGGGESELNPVAN
jgi:hypothetical protein